MPPSILATPRLGQSRSWWARLFGASSASGGSAVGSIRVNADDRSITQRYTGGLLARAPLREVSGDEGLQGLTVSELRGDASVAETRFGLGVARSNRRADALQALLDEARGQAPRRGREDTARLAADFAQSFHWSLAIPGTHYSGLSNQHLLEVLEAQGRPFAQDTPQLRDHVRERLTAAFASSAWDHERAVVVTARAVREWIVRRIDEQGLDVDLTPLDPDYRSWKSAHGYSSHIGRKTGAWRGSVANATVEVAA